MKAIIPLAGPGFVNPDGSVKCETLIEGIPLLKLALESRPWWVSGRLTSRDLIFVLRDDPDSRRFHQEKLLLWYPLCRSVFLSDYSRGAAFSVLGGCALLTDLEEPICFDLADILFDVEHDPVDYFGEEYVGALALTFFSDNEVYSYLRRDDSGNVIEAVEKKVISKEASAGVYFFKSLSVYLKALANVVNLGDRYTYKDLYFICPILNGVFPQGLSVEALTVKKVRDIKI